MASQRQSAGRRGFLAALQGDDLVELAALGGVSGIDVQVMLRERDRAAQLVYQAVAERTDEIEAERRRDLAIRITNAMNGKA